MSWSILPPAQSPLRVQAIAVGAFAALDARHGAITAFADVVRDRLGARDVLLTDSGTSALRLAIELAVARPGAAHRVALPAWSCYDLVSAAIGAGVEMDFYDLDPTTLAPESASLAAAVARSPAAIVLVHAFGLPIDVDSIRAQLPAGTLVIEDCAQAWGAAFADQVVGSRGDFALFSFGRGKGITGGGGGALALHFDRPPYTLAAAASGARDVAACLALWALSAPAMYAIPARIPALRLGETRYRPPHDVSSITRAAAATLLRGLADSDAGAVSRARVAADLHAMLLRNPTLAPVVAHADALPTWLRLPVLAASADARARLVHTGRAFGVAASYPQPLPALLAELRGGAVGAWPGAERLSRTLCTLPTHASVTPHVIARLDAVLR